MDIIIYLFIFYKITFNFLFQNQMNMDGGFQPKLTLMTRLILLTSQKDLMSH